MATMRGQVTSTGGVGLGSGFVPEKTNNETGKYTVKFNTPFKYTPVIVATGVGTDAAGYRLVTLYDVSTEGFSVTTRKGSDRKDSAFNFYASDDYHTP